LEFGKNKLCGAFDINFLGDGLTCFVLSFYPAEEICLALLYLHKSEKYPCQKNLKHKDLSSWPQKLDPDNFGAIISNECNANS